jgi:hypothetical protein
MKKIKLLAIIGLITLFNNALQAQVTLPYYTGFDNASQQNGWAEYKKAATTFSHWGYASVSAYSAPNCISHDYSPSTGITLTDNWYVSPSFMIPSGGKLDSIRYMFSGFSTPVTDDTIAIYLLNGSQDPALATSKTLLFDFRNADYVTDNTYRIKTNIMLSASGGASYFAVRYRNSDCSSKWLSVYFDNIAIRGTGTGIIDLSTGKDKVSIYPIPAKDRLQIDMGAINGNILASVYNAEGRLVMQNPLMQSNTSIDVSGITKGLYVIKLSTEEGIFVKKFIKE